MSSLNNKDKAPKLSNDLVQVLKQLSFDEMRVVIGIFLHSANGGGRLWDLLTCLRGPDSPSERPDMTAAESSKAYAGRRERKYKTVEVIRANAFFGVVGGTARSHNGDSVLIPRSEYWDHFAKHVYKAAKAIGLKIKYEGEDGESEK